MGDPTRGKGDSSQSQPSLWLASNARYVIAGLLLFTLCCRLRLLSASQSIWYDEAYLILNISSKSYLELLGPMKNLQAAPLVFMWLVKLLFACFGPCEWALRLPAAVAGLCGVVVAIPLGKQFAGRAGSVWVVAFTALSFHGFTLANDVKPYAFDLLFTELTLWAGCVYVNHRTRKAWGGLCVLALLGPWCSYPVLFSLGGVGAAWLLVAWQQRQRRVWCELAVYGASGALSCVALWLLVARHQRDPALSAFWQHGFLDCTSLTAFANSTWTLTKGMCQYASTGLGIPLVILSGIGWFVLIRRAKPLFLMLVTALLLALLASALRLYPLDDRLGYFAAPLFWVPSAVAIGALVERLRGRWSWGVLVVMLLLPVSDFGRILPNVWRGYYGPQFRAAFEYFHTQQMPHDYLWQPFVEVYQVYHGPYPRTLHAGDSEETIIRTARGHRIWLITPPDGAIAGHEPVRRLHQRLAESGWVRHHDKAFRQVVVVLYEPKDDADLGK